MMVMNLSLCFSMLIILALAPLSSCKTSQKNLDSKLKLIGGQEISENQWPSVRKLKIYEKESSGAYSLRAECTMTFVTPNIALTAAHCLCHPGRLVYSEKERWDDFFATSYKTHPDYKCSAKSPNAFDVGLVWFEEKVAMPSSKIVDDNPDEPLNRLRLVGYGQDVLKITGNFWIGTRKPITESSKPSPRKGELEFDGKHMGEASWRGDAPDDPGFIRLTAVYDVKSEVREPMTEASSAVGDSGGPAFTLEGNKILGVISRGSYRFTGLRSERVEVVTELIDLRRNDIRDFLKAHGALGMEAAL